MFHYLIVTLLSVVSFRLKYRKGFAMGESLVKVGFMLVGAISVAAIIIMWREGVFTPLPSILTYLRNTFILKIVDAGV